MRDIQDKTDGTGDILAAAAFNTNLINELQDFVVSAGFTLDPEAGPDTDTLMFSKSVCNYSVGAMYFIESGAADAYVLSRSGTIEAMSSYFDGATVLFKPTNSNTGVSTINVDGIGIVDLVDSSGAALTGGELTVGTYAMATFNSSSGDFELISFGGGGFALDSLVVHRAGDEIITGNKLLTGTTSFGSSTALAVALIAPLGDFATGLSTPVIFSNVGTGTLRPGSANNLVIQGRSSADTDIIFGVGSTPTETMTIIGSTKVVDFLNTPTVGGSDTVYHTGNDGSGSGLDADLLDGQEGSYYAVDSEVVHQAGAETVTGTKTFDAGPTLSNNIALLAKQLAGTVRPIIVIDTSDICYVGNNNIATTIRSNGTLTHNGDAILTSADIVESTFTPTIEGSTAAGTGTYTIQVGYYQQIGNWIHYRITVAWTAHTGTGNMRVAGLPATTNADRNATATVEMENITFSGAYVIGLLPASVTYIGLYGVNSGAGPTAVAVSNGGTLNITGSYQV